MKKKMYTVPIVVGGIVLLFGGLWFSSRSGYAPVDGEQKISDMGNRHIASIDTEHELYNSNPPTSGPHMGGIAPWGVSTQIIPDEQQIHNLEDGGVIVQYNPDLLPKEEWKVLEDTAMEVGRKNIIVAPRYDMEYPIALTAWNRLLPLNSIDEEKIRAFITAYEGIDHHR